MNVARYAVTSNHKSRFQIDFKAEAVNVVGLRAAPDELEPDLRSDKWLVLAFAIWDSKDRSAIDVACDVAADASTFRVAVRPFEFGDEFASWVPGFSSDAGSLSLTEADGAVTITTRSDEHPMWFAMLDGKNIAALVGAREYSDVKQFVQKHLA